MIQNSEIRSVYSELQKQLFYLIPEKWDRIYLYASVEEKMLGLETGEMFFYYFPKGILKKNPINVYEIPNRFNLNEEEYIKLVEKLYKQIKKIWLIFKKANNRIWTNLTIRIEGLKFEIEYNYENFTSTKYSNIDRHIIWKYNNLKLPEEAFTSKEKKIIHEYMNENIYFCPDIEKYSETIYKNPVRRTLYYNKEPKEEYVNTSRVQQIEIEPKDKFEEKHYTYNIKRSKKVKRIHEDRKKDNNSKTYLELVEEQRNSVKSQILKHI